MKEAEQIYFKIWEAEAEAEAQQKEAEARAEAEPQQEIEQEPTATEFYVYSDAIKHNRNLTIIDSKEKEAQNKQEFKVIGRLSKSEKKILRAIKK